MRYLLGVGIFGWACWASAVELKFGPEFTLSNAEIMHDQPVNRMEEGLPQLRIEFFKNPTLKKYYETLLEILKQKLVLERSPDQAFEISRQFVDTEERVVLRSPNGWQAMLGLDPGVFEWTMAPMTHAEYKKHAAEIQYVLFDLPKEVGLEPLLFAGGGHINIGAGAFSDNRGLLVRFIRDFLNHAELSLGVWNYDTNNSLNYWLVPNQIENLRRELQMIDRPESYLSHRDFAKLLSQILSAPYGDEYLYHFRPPTYVYKSIRNNSWALAFKSDSRQYPDNDLASWRLEIRSVRPQASFDVFLRQTELLQGRVNFLEKNSLGMNLHNSLAIQYDRPFNDRLFNPPVDPQAAIGSFHQYVTESGLAWKDHQNYLWPMWITGGEVAKFNQTQQTLCPDLLVPEMVEAQK